MQFCPNCGFQIAEASNFCPKCGHSLQGLNQQSISPLNESQEVAYYKGKGEIVIKTTKQKGLATKVAVLTFTGPLGYLIWGRDKKRTVKGRGNLVVTNKAIYCAGRDYPFEKIVSFVKQRDSILLEVDVGGTGYRSSGWEDVLKSGIAEGYTVKLKIWTRDVNRLFDALEKAKFSKIKF